MAKIKYSALVSDMRGKLNGSVLSKNHYGSYMRNKVTPSNPQSINQVQQRSLLAQFSAKWKTLTQEQMLAWRGAVGSWARTDIFGDAVNPTGNTLFNRINMSIAVLGGSPVLVPTAPSGVNALDSLSLTAESGAGDMEIDVTSTDMSSDDIMVIEATPCISPGIFNANNQFRVIATAPALGTTNVDIKSAYAAKFGALQAGKKVMIRVSVGNKATGERSQPLKDSVIVA